MARHSTLRKIEEHPEETPPLEPPRQAGQDRPPPPTADAAPAAEEADLEALADALGWAPGA